MRPFVNTYFKEQVLKHRLIPKIITNEILRIALIAEEERITCNGSMVRTDGESGLLISFSERRGPSEVALQIYWSPIQVHGNETVCTISLRCGKPQSFNPYYRALLKLSTSPGLPLRYDISVEGRDSKLQDRLQIPDEFKTLKPDSYHFAEMRLETRELYEETLRLLLRVYVDQPTDMITQQYAYASIS